MARFDLTPAGNLSCRLQAPPACEIVAARVEGVPVNLTPLEAGENVWELELSSSQLPQRLEVVFQGQLARPSGAEWNLIAPKLTSATGDLEVAQTLWTVLGPQGTRPLESADDSVVSLQHQQMARIEALAELLQGAETTALALPKDDTANWYSLWARRLAVAQRELKFAPPLPGPLSQAELARLAEIEQAQFDLADRLEIASKLTLAANQAATLPPEAPRWISLGRQLRPAHRYVFAGEQSSLQLATAPAATSVTLKRMLVLALWVILAAGCLVLVRGSVLATLAARWPGLLVVLAGVLWSLWLVPFWLGIVLICLGLWAAVRGERPTVMTRQKLAS